MLLAAAATRKRFLLFVIAALLSRLAMFALVDTQATLRAGDTQVLMAGSSFVPPGYPFFLANVSHPLIFQTLLTLAVGWLLAVRVNYIAALLFVTSPFLILFEWRLLTECLAINFLVVAAVLAFRPCSFLETIIAGLAMAAAILVRDTLLFLPIFALFDRRARIAVIACYLALAPIQLARGSIMLSEGRMGLNLWKGTWERHPSPLDRGFDANAPLPPEAFRSPGEEKEVRAAIAQRDDTRLKKIAIDRLHDQPLLALNWFTRQRYMWLGTRTELHQLRFRRDSPAWKTAKAAFWLLNTLTLIFGLSAIAIERRWALLIPLVYLALIYLPFHSTEPRYSLFALPFLYLAIGVFLKRRSAHGPTPHEGHRSAPSPAPPAAAA